MPLQVSWRVVRKVWAGAFLDRQMELKHAFHIALRTHLVYNKRLFKLKTFYCKTPY